MSDTEIQTPASPAPASSPPVEAPKWPTTPAAPVSPPVTQAVLANAAARAAATNSRRDLITYLRLRRKSA
jgi:hypothetical protein